MKKAIGHARFCFEVYSRRMQRGKHFLHEHPWSAWSWKLDFVQAFLARPDVFLARGDQCSFGQTS
eukprot:2630664-Prorocentrum_lima.AAC.1